MISLEFECVIPQKVPPLLDLTGSVHGTVRLAPVRKFFNDERNKLKCHPLYRPSYHGSISWVIF
jgi:hypothetical protein